MRRRTAVLELAAVFLGAVAIVCGCDSGDGGGPTGSISGTAYYSGAETGTHTLIVYVSIDLDQDPVATGQYTVSDAELAAGYDFSVAGIPPGTYMLMMWWDVIEGGGPDGDPTDMDFSFQVVGEQDTALGDCTLGPKGSIVVSVDGGADDTVVGLIQIATYVTSAQDPFPAESMVVMAGEMGSSPMAMITFKGSTAATYDVAAGNATVMYADAGGKMYIAMPGLSTGTVTATAV